MRGLTELSVEWVAEMLRPLLHNVPEPGLGFAVSPRKPEDGLPQRFSSDWRYSSAVLAALFLALSALAAFAQQPAPFPAPATTTATPDTSTPLHPPQAASGASTPAQLLLAEQQGKADTAILDWVLANSGPLVGDARAGEFRIAFTITPAEGWWDKAAGGTLAWHEAPDGNVHLRIFVLNLADGRMVPGLTLRATLTDANGNEQSVPVDFGWYPLMNAYGGNFPLDADSVYTLRVTVGRSNFEHTTVAEFPPVPIVQEAMLELPLATATASANESELLKPSNAALSAAITTLWQQSVSGVENPAGDYFVAYALDYSGLSMPLAGAKLHPKNLLELTGKDNVRLAVLVRDSRTGRLIPQLKPQANLIAADGKPYGPGEMPPVIQSWLYHYGRNTRIPRKGLYKLRVHFDAPGFRRWGRQSERFAAPADIEFEDVSLQPKKVSPPSGKKN
jgi:hypothetical protein